MILTILIGPPGCGKSTYVEPFRQRHGAAVVLSSDEIRGILGTGEGDQSVSRQAFQTLECAAEILLRQGRDVVIDATNTTVKARKAFIALGVKYKALIEMIVSTTSIEQCKARNAARERKVPEDVIDRMARQLEIPKKFVFDSEGEIVSGECHDVKFI